MPGFITAAVTFLMAAFIIYLSYVCSKYLGKGLVKGGSSKYMSIVDQLVVGQNRTLTIVRVSGRYLLLGITQEQIQVLTDLKEEELFPLGNEAEGEPVLNFNQVLTKLGRRDKDSGAKDSR